MGAAMTARVGSGAPVLVSRRLVLLSPLAVLPPSSEGGFQRALRAINDDAALGPGCKALGISIEKDHARLTLEVEGKRLEVRLRPGRQDRYFEQEYDEQSWRGHEGVLGRLRSVLQRAFDADPWVEPESPSSDPFRPHLESDPTMPRRTKLGLLLGWGVLAGALMFGAIRGGAVIRAYRDY